MEIKPILYDVECYQNYFMIGYSVATKKNDKYTFKRDYVDTNDMNKLVKFLNKIYYKKDTLVFVGFNNMFYDKCMLEEAYNLRYEDKQTMLDKLYILSSTLVNGSNLSFKYRLFSQFDLLLRRGQSLKSSGVILHRNEIEELPYDPKKILNDEEIKNIIYYNQHNDLGITEELFLTFEDKFNAKLQVINTFELPMSAFSYTERQLAEEVLCDRNSSGNPNKTTTYTCPLDFKFKDKKLNSLKEEYENTVFKYGDKFRKSIEWQGLDVEFALGGLHAALPQYEGENLIDIDVASYYPNLLRVFDLLPQSVAHKELYYKMISDRVALKKTDPDKAGAYKIILNALYGALGYVSAGGRVGKLFDFNKLLGVTITGQLLMMKLAENLHLKGHKITYINTDGLMIEPKNDSWKQIIKDWEDWSGLTLEDNFIKICYLKDVNNYIVKDENDKIKTKGQFNINVRNISSLVSNHAKRRISIDAVIKYIVDKKPIEETINNSKDIRDFIIHHKFGNQYIDRKISDDNKELGKVFRWYKSNKRKNNISAKNNNTNTIYTVPMSKNSTVIDKISDYDMLPEDLDRQFYIDEAYSIYNNLTDKNITGNEEAIEMYNEILYRLKKGDE